MIYGLDDEWNACDEGDHAIYTQPPDRIDPTHYARVVHELRQDVQRLNSEAMDLHEQNRRAVERGHMLAQRITDALLALTR